MKNLCTVSDINYLYKGLTLYESLKSKTKNFILHYLCIDDESFNKLRQFESESLKVYHVETYLESDTELKSLKNSDYRYFCWSLASYFTNKLLLTDVDAITYIDSDIYFHQDFNYILNEIGDREIGMFRHRQFPLSTPRPEGHYNVGVVHFKKTDIGKELCSWWSDSVLNKKHPEYATCGDQKYLEYFTVACPPELLYIDENIGHGAPWHWQTLEFLGDGKVKFEGQEQELVFTHFSQFEDGEHSYIPSTMHHIYTPLAMYKNNKTLKAIYDEYHLELANVKIKYNGTKR